jgi:hypothetical protein
VVGRLRESGIEGMSSVLVSVFCARTPSALVSSGSSYGPKV